MNQQEAQCYMMGWEVKSIYSMEAINAFESKMRDVSSAMCATVGCVHSFFYHHTSEFMIASLF